MRDRFSNFQFRVSRAARAGADLAQFVEHVLGKDGVSGSIPLIGSRILGRPGYDDLSMSESSFEVFVPDYTSSVDEYRRAQSAPKAELPELTDDQKAVARGFKISEEEYARGVLAGIYGHKRQVDRGRRLGEKVQTILAELGTPDRVARVTYQIDRLRWLVSIRTADRIVDVAVPRELADDILDSALRKQAEEFRLHVATSLGIATPVTES